PRRDRSSPDYRKSLAQSSGGQMRRAATMRWVMLPWHPPNARIRVSRISLIGMKSNLAPRPVKGAAAPKRLHHGKPSAKPDARSQRQARGVIGRKDVEWRMLGRWPGAVDICRIINRQIDVCRI